MYLILGIYSFINVGTLVFVQIFEVRAVQVSACYTSPCNFFSLNCTARGRIQVNSLQYGIYGFQQVQCPNTNCHNDGSCCMYVPGDCLEDFNNDHKKLILDQCAGNSSCGPIQAVFHGFTALPNCPGPFSQYVVIDYTCVHGVEDKQQSVSIIIGVVVTTVVLLVITVVMIIWYKRRRCKTPVEDEFSKNDPPSVLLNRSVVSNNELNIGNAAVEKSNYDVINEESISNYSQPVRVKKYDRDVSKEKRNDGKDISSEEYDRIEFEKKCSQKHSNYDALPAVDANIHDNTYSHVPGQSKYVPTSAANEYSHCNIDRKESSSNEHSNRDYSHADLDKEWKRVSSSSIKSQDSYCHIDFDKTKHSV